MRQASNMRRNLSKNDRLTSPMHLQMRSYPPGARRMPPVMKRSSKTTADRRHRPNRIRQLRRVARLTQSELAGLVGVDVQTVGRWERQEVAILEKHWDRLAEVLNTTVTGLFTEPDPIRHVPVTGAVASGVWHPGTRPADGSDWAVMPRDSDFDTWPLFAVRVEDGALEHRLIGRGSLLFYVPFEEERRCGIRNGVLYVVERRRAAGVERTARLAMETPDGARWFVPDAASPAYEAFPQMGGPDEAVVVLGRVVFIQAKPS